MRFLFLLREDLKVNSFCLIIDEKEKLVPIIALPEWCHCTFPKIK